MIFSFAMNDGRSLAFDDSAGTLTDTATGLSAGTFIRKNALGSFLFRINGIEHEAAFNNGDPQAGSDIFYDILPWPHDKAQRVTVGKVLPWQ